MPRGFVAATSFLRGCQDECLSWSQLTYCAAFPAMMIRPKYIRGMGVLKVAALAPAFAPALRCEARQMPLNMIGASDARPRVRPH